MFDDPASLPLSPPLRRRSQAAFPQSAPMAGPIAAVGGPQAPGGGKPTHVKLVTARSPLKHVTVRLTSLPARWE
jgi:hypothetical protein